MLAKDPSKLGCWGLFLILLLFVPVSALIFVGGPTAVIAYILFYVFALLVGWTITVHVRRLLQPKRGRLLFLRRFHVETAPNFPVSRLMRVMDSFGYEVVTLADSRVRRNTSRPMMLSLSAILAFIIWLIWWPLLLILPFVYIAVARFALGLIAGSVSALSIGHLNAQVLIMVVGGVALSAAWIMLLPKVWNTVRGPISPYRKRRPTDQAQREEQIQGLLAYLVDHAPGGLKNWTRKSPQKIERAAAKSIRGFFDVGLTVIRCADENWRDAVEALVKTSNAVCIDISNPSEHIQTEIGLLALHAPASVIWMRQDDDPLPPATGGGYTVLGHEFDHSHFSFTYPSDPTGVNYYAPTASVTAIAERLLEVLEAMRVTNSRAGGY